MSRDGGPAALRCRGRFDGGEHALDLQAVGERRDRVVAGRDVGEQVDDLVGEGVLVPDQVARRPPGSHVGVVGLGDLDPGPSRHLGVRLGVVDEQLVHRLEVEREAPAAAVHLEPDHVLPAGREPGGLERRRAPHR